MLRFFYILICLFMVGCASTPKSNYLEPNQGGALVNFKGNALQFSVYSGKCIDRKNMIGGQLLVKEDGSKTYRLPTNESIILTYNGQMGRRHCSVSATTTLLNDHTYTVHGAMGGASCTIYLYDETKQLSITLESVSSCP